MKNKSAIFSVLLAGLLLPLLFSCKKEAPKIIPTVTVGSVTKEVSVHCKKKHSNNNKLTINL